MIPERAEAERLLREAEQHNPGPWGNHSRVVAHCAEKLPDYATGQNIETSDEEPELLRAKRKEVVMDE